MKNKDPIRVMIADDHAIVRKGLKALLIAVADLELIGEATNGRDAVALCKELRPDIILMDLIMPVVDGIEAIRQIQQQLVQPKIIALTSFDDEKLVRGALEAGANGYLLKNVSAEELALAIRSVYNGRPTISPEATQILIEAMAKPITPHNALTEREQDVLALMVKGLTNNQIADQLQISRYTVKNHISNILSKLGAATRTEATTLAIQQEIVHLA